MSERGTFAVDRGIFDHDFFAPEPFTEREAWLWMIGAAAYRPRRVRVGVARIDLTRGQFAHSTRFMGEKWKWPETTVRRFLGRLQAEGMVGAGKAQGVTLITICNYDSFQWSIADDDDANGAPTAHQRRKVESIEEKIGGDGGGTRASGSLSPEALLFAAELAMICGHNPEILPPQWVSAGPAMRVQMMLDKGWRVDVMRDAAKATMQRKRDGPPTTINYFDKIFARAHAPQTPLPVVVPTDQPAEQIHAQAQFRPPRGQGADGFGVRALRGAQSRGGE